MSGDEVGRVSWMVRSSKMPPSINTRNRIYAIGDKMAATLTMDKSGRIVLPMRVRKRFGTSRFELVVTENKLELTPVKPLESIFGTLPELDIEKIRREHEEEVRNERF